MISTLLVYLAVAVPQRGRNAPLSLYTRAVKSYYALNASPQKQQYRNNWLDVIDQFGEIYRKYPDSEYAPESLFDIGNLYNKLYTLSFLSSDLDHSIRAFDVLQRHYTKSKLSDDALFKIAEIYRTKKGDVKTAIDFYKRILEDYPSSDSAPMAKVWITRLGGTAAVKKTARTRPLCALQGIKVWSSGGYTRIVISVSNDIIYSGHLLKQEENDRTGKRVYVDLDGTMLTCNTAPVVVKDGIVEEIRTGQFNRDTVRVVMDVGNIDDYSIFNLEDPFRIIVDVKGKSTQKLTESRATDIHGRQPAAGAQFTAETTPAGLTISKIIQDYENLDRQELPMTVPVRQLHGLFIKKVVIDPGHGGKDPGAIGPNGVAEKNITLRIGRMLAERLKALGLQVIMTRDSDTFIPLEERTAIANMSNADLFISIHANASRSRRTKGITTYYLSPTRDRASMLVAARENATSAKKLSDLQLILEDLMKTAKINESATFADDIQEDMVHDLRTDSYETPSLGVRSAPFFVLLHANMPSILIETSFITNPHEERLLMKKSYERAIVDGIVKGIVQYGSNVKMAEQ
ncbi:MAG: N-acetylmuramoyl-L-alanine amidase [Deltaproteobacteria bacterium]|nr:N-acetylmuramoyl-L-alanine amidase [Deltaproteobacteria bacterium]MCL5276983.1 N-acetylmuramoyl-L-alanine amidase [Deltaproteobacteria bacterium]